MKCFIWKSRQSYFLFTFHASGSFNRVAYIQGGYGIFNLVTYITYIINVEIFQYFLDFFYVSQHKQKQCVK